MGSAADLEKNQDFYKLAYDIGSLIAKQGDILVFGAEKDYDSLSTAACRGAKDSDGLTVGITYGKGLETYESADIIIATGLERGGGREFSLVLSCDAVIVVSGGSGTLNEMVVAYQANIPLVALINTGGWADKMADQYFDGRNRVKVESATTPEEAVKIATKLAGQSATRAEHEHL